MWGQRKRSTVEEEEESPKKELSEMEASKPPGTEF